MCGAQVAPVVAKMQKRLQKYFALYCVRVSQRGTGKEGSLTTKGLLQFTRDFDLVPALCNQVCN